MNIKEVSDEKLVSRYKEVKGFEAMEKSLKNEIKRRLDEGVDLTPYGVTVGKERTVERVISKDKLRDVLEELNLQEHEALFIKETIQKGNLTVK